MASKDKKKNQEAAGSVKKNRGLMLTAAVIAAACLIVVMTGGKKEGTASKNTNTSAAVSQTGGSDSGAAAAAGEAGQDEAIVIGEGESLVIPIAEITETASFFPVEVDGTRMEVLAVKASDGTIRTAFNTCQICYSSGRGYYVQQGSALVCQNCGNRFTVDQVEIETGGCNPWPIFEEDKTVTEDSIEISYEFLTASREIFANWRTEYGK